MARRRIVCAMDKSLGRCAMPTVNKGQTPTILWHCCGAESGHAGCLHRRAIGTSHSGHLWCERHRLVFPCGLRFWDRTQNFVPSDEVRHARL